LIKTICTLDQESTVIILSTETEHKQLALDAGADAFANLSKPPRDLLAIINEMVLARHLEQ
jgi:DNA-binding response OmpR family regulator